MARSNWGEVAFTQFGRARGARGRARTRRSLAWCTTEHSGKSLSRLYAPPRVRPRWEVVRQPGGDRTRLKAIPLSEESSEVRSARSRRACRLAMSSVASTSRSPSWRLLVWRLCRAPARVPAHQSPHTDPFGRAGSLRGAWGVLGATKRSSRRRGDRVPALPARSTDWARRSGGWVRRCAVPLAACVP